jgi:hypothetical protein
MKIFMSLLENNNVEEKTTMITRTIFHDFSNGPT